MTQNQKGWFQTIYDTIKDSNILEKVQQGAQSLLNSTGQGFKNSLPGKIIDTVMIEPIRATRGMAQPLIGIKQGLQKTYQGLKKFGDGHVWDGPKMMSKGIAETIGGYGNALPAGFNLLKSYGTAAIAGKLGYDALKKIANSKTNQKIRKRRDDINNFKKNADELVDIYSNAAAKNWSNMRAKNLQSRFNEKRVPTENKQQSAPMFIITEAKGNPTQKELKQIEKKEIINAEQQYKHLHNGEKKS